MLHKKNLDILFPPKIKICFNKKFWNFLRRETYNRMYQKSGTVALKEERVVILAIMRAEAVMQLQQQQQSLFQTARIEVNAELLVQVCGNHRSQDVYVISSFFSHASSLITGASSPLPPPPFLSSRLHHSLRRTDARDETVCKCRRESISPALKRQLLFFPLFRCVKVLLCLFLLLDSDVICK